MRLTTDCRGHLSDEYTARTDPHGRSIFWLTGSFINEEPDNPDTDDALLARGFVTVVPTLLDRSVPSPLQPDWLPQLDLTF